MARKTEAKKYYSSRSALQVLGSLMLNPKWIESVEKPIDVEDFVGTNHKDLFRVVYNLNLQGVNQVGLAEVENYLHETSPVVYNRLFEKSNGQEWITKALEDANPENYDEYYNRVRKYALLRSYINEGINVSNILDLDDLELTGDEKQKQYFESLSIEDIIEVFDKQNIRSKERFIVRGENDSRKSGEEAQAILQAIMNTPPIGYGYESNYMNTITLGVQGNRLQIETRDSGTGKTRSAINRLVKLCSPYLWNNNTQQWEENKNGKGHAGLYLGTEMDLKLEIEPMIWCFIAGVSDKRLKANKLTPEEMERVNQAIIYANEAKIFQENNPDFTIRWLQQTIEKYNQDYDLKLVCLDYIELTPYLVQEFSEQMKGVNIREDQILLNLSKCLKEKICKPYDLTLIAYTQTNDYGRKEGVRNQGAVAGGKSLPNKADNGLTVFRPTKKELGTLEPIIAEKSTGFGKKLIPNICYTFYKTRWFSFGEEEGNDVPYNEIKVWGIQNLGTGEFIDCFVTNEHYELINLPKTRIDCREGKNTTD